MGQSLGGAWQGQSLGGAWQGRELWFHVDSCPTDWEARGR